MYLQVAHGTILAGLEVFHNTAFANYRIRTDKTFSPKLKISNILTEWPSIFYYLAIKSKQNHLQSDVYV